ncbi:MAG: UDP-N-acetylmuramoyl-L-alanine--D-glutamate ligase [Clostridia bacterium]|nr:UDP-N-acetylmuramoyl-L-alanine--D-glutamate ligase [Clostridia bacterium]
MSYHNEKLEEFENFIQGKKVAIIGLGVSNIPLIDYFYKLGAQVSIFDKKEKEKLDASIVKKLEQYHDSLYCGPNNMNYLEGFDVIFRSPSCRPDIPEIVKEIERGAILTTEIEMLMKLCPGTVVAITGSDGKTTTTNLIYQIIRRTGRRCFLGGNLGVPLFTKVNEMKPEDIVVLELSSFQLMDMQVSPHIAVITNISPNHLDIHKSYQEYIDAKKNIFQYQAKDDIVVLNYDNDLTRSFRPEIKGKTIFFSRKEKLESGIIYDEGTIKSCNENLRRHLLNVKDVTLRGLHNYENICAAIAATESLATPEQQAEAIKAFQGVEHRLELVRELHGTKWYNDSIGTSPSRTIAGLNAFEEKIILIAGGYDKHLDYTPIAKPIVEHVSKLILMGATAPKIEQVVKEELKAEGKELPIYHCNTLEEVIHTAYDIATPEEIVLFSPASASFDLFKNFEERGNLFKKLVNQL